MRFLCVCYMYLDHIRADLEDNMDIYFLTIGSDCNLKNKRKNQYFSLVILSLRFDEMNFILFIFYDIQKKYRPRGLFRTCCENITRINKWIVGRGAQIEKNQKPMDFRCSII